MQSGPSKPTEAGEAKGLKPWPPAGGVFPKGQGGGQAKKEPQQGFECTAVTWPGGVRKEDKTDHSAAQDPQDAEEVVRTRPDGLTEAEGEVMDCLVAAADAFDALELQHPQEEEEFYAALHRLQDLLGVRVLRRLYPVAWVTLDRRGELVG